MFVFLGRIWLHADWWRDRRNLVFLFTEVIEKIKMDSAVGSTPLPQHQRQSLYDKLCANQQLGQVQQTFIYSWSK